MKNCLIVIILSLIALNLPGQSISKKINLPGYVQINDTFFAGKYEVSIIDYVKSLVYIRSNLKDTVLLQKSLPDPNYTNWTYWNSYTKSQTIFNDDIISINDSSRISFKLALRDCPIVNISKAQAVQYCNWRTEDYQVFYKRLSRRKKKKYPSNVLFRLPTVKEWEMFAVMESKDSVTICKEFFYDLTKTFMPEPIFYGQRNAIGIFNMTGNVSEIVSDNDSVYGGSFKDGLKNCTPTSKAPFVRGTNSIGFRLVAVIRE